MRQHEWSETDQRSAAEARQNKTPLQPLTLKLRSHIGWHRGREMERKSRAVKTALRPATQRLPTPADTLTLVLEP